MKKQTEIKIKKNNKTKTKIKNVSKNKKQKNTSNKHGKQPVVPMANGFFANICQSFKKFLTHGCTSFDCF